MVEFVESFSLSLSKGADHGGGCGSLVSFSLRVVTLSDPGKISLVPRQAQTFLYYGPCKRLTDNGPKGGKMAEQTGMIHSSNDISCMKPFLLKARPPPPHPASLVCYFSPVFCSINY